MPSSRAPEPLRQGLVVAGHGRHVVVEDEAGTRRLCHPRGKKLECVVGDRVAWQPTGDEGVVERVAERRTLFFRQDAWRTKAFAANIDQLLVVVAAEPPFSEAQLARALIAAHAAGVPARIVLNKRDLPSFAAARTRLAAYEAMGVPIVETALEPRAPVAPEAGPDAARSALLPLLDERTTLVLGPSGAGKSTLVNLVAPGANAETGEISRALNSGRHTTTATHWHWLDATRRSAIVDSPGFQSFGLAQIEPAALAGHMPDLAAHAGGCRYYNCLHVSEPGCGVLAALEAGAIDASRYRIYREVLAELEGWRRMRPGAR